MFARDHVDVALQRISIHGAGDVGDEIRVEPFARLAELLRARHHIGQPRRPGSRREQNNQLATRFFLRQVDLEFLAVEIGVSEQVSGKFHQSVSTQGRLGVVWQMRWRGGQGHPRLQARA